MWFWPDPLGTLVVCHAAVVVGRVVRVCRRERLDAHIWTVVELDVSIQVRVHQSDGSHHVLVCEETRRDRVGDSHIWSQQVILFLTIRPVQVFVVA